MTLYDFEVTINDSVFADDSYDAMEAIEKKIKNGEVSPDEINIKIQEKEGE